MYAELLFIYKYIYHNIFLLFCYYVTSLHLFFFLFCHSFIAKKVNIESIFVKKIVILKVSYCCAVAKSSFKNCVARQNKTKQWMLQYFKYFRCWNLIYINETRLNKRERNRALHILSKLFINKISIIVVNLSRGIEFNNLIYNIYIAKRSRNANRVNKYNDF